MVAPKQGTKAAQDKGGDGKAGAPAPAPAPAVSEQQALADRAADRAAQRQGAPSADADAKRDGDVVDSGGDTAVPDAVRDPDADPTRAGGSAPAGTSSGVRPAPDGPHGDDPTRTADSTPAVRTDSPEEVARARSAAAPLEAPKGGVEQNAQPNFVAGASGLRSLQGERHLGLIGEDDKKIDAASMFEDGDPALTYVTVKERVYEQFGFRGTVTPQTRLLYPKGARVSRDRAQALQTSAGRGGRPQ